MKKIYAILLASAFLPTVASAAEKLDTYLHVEAGRAFFDEFNKDDYNSRKPKDDYVYGIGLGKNIIDGFSVEGNIHHFADIEIDERKGGVILNQKLKATNLGLNLKYSANKLHSKIIPFVGVGAGLAFVDSGTYVLSQPSTANYIRIDGKSKYNFAYNAEVGVTAPITKELSIKLGYHFFDLGKNGSSKDSIDASGNLFVNDDGQASTKIRVHAGMLGLQYNF